MTNTIGIQAGIVTKVTGSITNPTGISKKEGRNARSNKGAIGINQLLTVNPYENKLTSSSKDDEYELKNVQITSPGNIMRPTSTMKGTETVHIAKYTTASKGI